jgi:helicase
MRPLLSIRSKEWDDIQDILLRHEDKMLMDEPSLYEDDYDEFMKSVKTALFFQDWINEHNEDALLEHYGIRPGEIRIKLSLADWLLYGMEELTRIMEFRDLLKDVSRLRYRVKYGVKEELMTLVRLKGIGRVRARMLFRNGIRDIKGLKNVDIGKLRQLVGNKTAENIKKELDQEILGVKKGTRKGQLSVQKFS